jgi:hypothetical protein
MYHLLYKAWQHGFEKQLKYAKKETVPQLHSWIVGKLNYFAQFAPEKTKKLQLLYVKAKETHKNNDVTLFEFNNGTVLSAGEDTTPPWVTSNADT